MLLPSQLQLKSQELALPQLQELSTIIATRIGIAIVVMITITSILTKAPPAVPHMDDNHAVDYITLY